MWDPWINLLPFLYSFPISGRERSLCSPTLAAPMYFISFLGRDFGNATVVLTASGKVFFRCESVRKCHARRCHVKRFHTLILCQRTMLYVHVYAIRICIYSTYIYATRRQNPKWHCPWNDLWGTQPTDAQIRQNFTGPINRGKIEILIWFFSLSKYRFIHKQKLNIPKICKISFVSLHAFLKIFETR